MNSFPVSGDWFRVVAVKSKGLTPFDFETTPALAARLDRDSKMKMRCCETKTNMGFGYCLEFGACDLEFPERNPAKTRRRWIKSTAFAIY
jgi:hypothetical protein